jgi:hypothetical protein
MLYRFQIAELGTYVNPVKCRLREAKAAADRMSFALGQPIHVVEAWDSGAKAGPRVYTSTRGVVLRAAATESAR